MRGQAVVVELLHRRRGQGAGIQGLRIAAGYRTDRCMPHVNDALAALPGLIEIDQDAAQRAIVVKQRQFVGHLTNAEAQLLRIRWRAGHFDAGLQGVQRRLAIAVGPPQARIGDDQLRSIGGGELERAATGRHRDVAPDAYIAEGQLHRALHCCGSVVAQWHVDFEFRAVMIRCQLRGDHLRITERHWTCGMQLHVLPQTGIAIAHRRNPVPAFAGDEGRPVQRLHAAIFADTGRHRLFVRDAGMRWRRHPYRNDVPARLELLADIEATACECAAGTADLGAIDPDLAGIIDAVEQQFQSLALQCCRHIETAAVPPVLPAQRFGNRHVVEADIRIRIHASIDQRGEYRARHGRGAPAGLAGGVIAARQRRTAGLTELWRRSELPCTDPPCGGIQRLQRRHLRHRPGDRRREGRGTARQGRRRLRCELPCHLLDLHAPAGRCVFKALLRRIRRLSGKPCDGCRIQRTGLRSEACDLAAEVLRIRRRLLTRAEHQRGRDRSLLHAAAGHLAAIGIQAQARTLRNRGDLRPDTGAQRLLAAQHMLGALGKAQQAVVDDEETASRLRITEPGNQCRAGSPAGGPHPGGHAPIRIGGQQRCSGGKLLAQPETAREHAHVVGTGRIGIGGCSLHCSPGDASTQQPQRSTAERPANHQH